MQLKVNLRVLLHKLFVEAAESVQHVASHIGLRQDRGPEMIGSFSLAKSTSWHHANTSLLEQLLHVKEIGLNIND